MRAATGEPKQGCVRALSSAHGAAKDADEHGGGQEQAPLGARCYPEPAIGSGLAELWIPDTHRRGSRRRQTPRE